MRQRANDESLDFSSVHVDFAALENLVETLHDENLRKVAHVFHQNVRRLAGLLLLPQITALSQLYPAKGGLLSGLTEEQIEDVHREINRKCWRAPKSVEI